MPRILVTHSAEELRTRFPSKAVDKLKTLGEVRFNESGQILTTDELIELADGCDVVLSDRLTACEARFFAGRLEIVAVCRGAVDIRNIDLKAASDAGVLITNASPTFIAAVAELGFGLMIALARGFRAAILDYAQGKEPAALMGTQLKDSTLGVIGYGAIGRQVARLGQAFGMTVLICDPYVSHVDPGMKRVGLESLLNRADFVVCLAISTPETDRMMDARAFAAMKPNAYFVNLARGTLVDDDALEQALRDNRIAGAALDVGNEPGQMPKLSIAALPNVIAAPHVGGLTRQAAEGQAVETVEQVAEILQGRVPHNALNAENATRLRKWSRHSGACRNPSST